jgi:hypothetical protein
MVKKRAEEKQSIGFQGGLRSDIGMVLRFSGQSILKNDS